MKLKKPVLKLLRYESDPNYNLTYIALRNDCILELNPIRRGAPSGFSIAYVSDFLKEQFNLSGFDRYYFLYKSCYDILEPTNLACMLYGEKNES